MIRDRVTLAFLAALTAVALFFCYLLVAPFLKTIAFAIILAVVFYPVQVRMHRWIQSRNVAALVSTSAVLLILGLASTFLGGAIVSGLRDIYQSLVNPSDGKEKLGLYLVHLLGLAAGWINGYLPLAGPNVQDAITSQAEKLISNLLSMSASMLGGITSLIADAAISFFILFFLFRDGEAMLHRGAAAVPLKRGQILRLIVCVKETLDAIVYGTITIAILQGALTGIAFAALGISSPVLWGVVTGLCALLPVVGTAFVFVPAMGMLAFNGHWMKALILLFCAVAIVHPVDNVLRPYLIGGRTKLSTLFVFFALLGGLRAFGTFGIFIGPLILAVTLSLLEIMSEEWRAVYSDAPESGTATEPRADVEHPPYLAR